MLFVIMAEVIFRRNGTCHIHCLPTFYVDGAQCNLDTPEAARAWARDIIEPVPGTYDEVTIHVCTFGEYLLRCSGDAGAPVCTATDSCPAEHNDRPWLRPWHQ